MGDIDERVLLYNQFKKSLTETSSSEFFDEDVLVEIFDYAGDVNDDYVRMEVLLYGARVYPHSETLKIRRGYFYFTQGIDEGVTAMIKTAQTPSALWDILKLRNESVDAVDVKRQLDLLIDKYDTFDDETVIQLVDVASALNAFDWLKENVHRLKRKCEYRQVLYYEIASMAEINNDFAFAAEMMEQLTMIEPFNVQFWEMLAQYYANDFNVDKAITAAEYALAIDADSLPSIVIKAQCLLKKNENLDHIDEQLARGVKQNPDDSLAVQTLAVVKIERGLVDEAVALLLDYIARNKTDKDVIDYLLVIDEQNIKEILDKCIQSETAPSETVWIDWADRNVFNGNYRQAREILSCYNRNEGLQKGLLLYFEVLYRLGNYGDVLHQYNNYEGEIYDEHINMIVALSLLRSNKKKEAKVVAERIFNDTVFESCCDISSKLQLNALESVMKGIVELAGGSASFSIDDIDPFK